MTVVEIEMECWQSASLSRHTYFDATPQITQNAFQLMAYLPMPQNMPLRCPFCNAEEDERINAVDREGRRLVLVMFDCPFFYKFPEDQVGKDESLQTRLNEWRKKEGDAWLETLGSIIREREMRGIRRFQETLRSN